MLKSFDTKWNTPILSDVLYMVRTILLNLHIIMFQWKVITYCDIDGKTRRHQQEFDSYEDYVDFLHTQQDVRSHFRRTRWHRGNIRWATSCHQLQEISQDIDVDIKKYRNSLKQIEQDEAQKNERKTSLELLKNKLTGYKEKFESLDQKELVKDVQKDLEKVEKELSAL